MVLESFKKAFVNAVLRIKPVSVVYFVLPLSVYTNAHVYLCNILKTLIHMLQIMKINYKTE